MLSHSLLEMADLIKCENPVLQYRGGFITRTWRPVLATKPHSCSPRFRIKSKIHDLSNNLLWKMRLPPMEVKGGETRTHTPQMSCLGLVTRGFEAWPGCFSHTPVCAFCHLSGWCEILTEEA